MSGLIGGLFLGTSQGQSEHFWSGLKNSLQQVLSDGCFFVAVFLFLFRWGGGVGGVLFGKGGGSIEVYELQLVVAWKL